MTENVFLSHILFKNSQKIHDFQHLFFLINFVLHDSQLTLHFL